ncbi:hypothetical protein SLEP1_g43282 [Rubroshorea leprosula]|uniref:NAC domain-containing protein n=1 Tax=Rubroshorea leprosula TaxID=152421 RepID=A0AAV5LCH5_9ROSI|nr:hypothetical protein SLEP1_g43282 [Rubroshorea leprosula]
MEEYPKGFRFYPTEEELVSFYLCNKLDGNRPEMQLVIPVINIYDVEPWQLPELSGELCKADPEQWFFFTPRQTRQAHGGRTSRTTDSGYWKATGSPSYVYSSDNRVIGMKKSMVFYKGKAPFGRKTKWKMNEYSAIQMVANPSASAATPKLRHEFSLCRVYVVSGSLRAFDRRPLEAVSCGTPLQGDGPATSQSAAMMMERTASSGTSNFKGDHFDLPETSGDNCIWGMDDQSDLLETSEADLWRMVNDPEQSSWK